MIPRMKPSIIALIPARSGSTRVHEKNIRPLGGHPLLAYSIAAARASNVFDAVVVSTDSQRYADIARHYGAEIPFLRPAAMAGPLSPDIEWVEHTVMRLTQAGRAYDCFAILRPTSPFRTAATIGRAWDVFRGEPRADSLRAVEKCTQHPAKMWVIRGGVLLPLMPFGPVEQPWHSSAYQTLPEIYVQNASLEIAWCRVVRDTRTIAGNVIVPFLTEGTEGFDVNNEEDWALADLLISQGKASLPPVTEEPAVLPA